MMIAVEALRYWRAAQRLQAAGHRLELAEVRTALDELGRLAQTGSSATSQRSRNLLQLHAGSSRLLSVRMLAAKALRNAEGPQLL